MSIFFLIKVNSNKPFNISFLLLTLATVCIAAAGYIINDYYDIKIDIINKPGRVVIGRIFKRRTAMIFHFILNGTGIIAGLMMGLRLGIIIAFCGFLLWLYSNQLKRQPLSGNIAISFLTALSIMLVGIFAKERYISVLVYAVFAFFISLIREIVKDMEDVKGDANFGCKTLPIIWGIRKTKSFLFIIGIIFIVSLIIGYFWLMRENPYNLYFIGYNIFFVIFPFFIFLIYLSRADTIIDFKKLSIFCKVIMLTGVLSMLFV
ncbi:MAG: geranylgeranylglycerol-phosphate geranylgeranyltransferase [Sporocytophaga sp.]|nr:geranylgeranylglycerol-phosphate geranylgeranyltransferase [Sporocytophaga sp.]